MLPLVKLYSFPNAERLAAEKREGQHGGDTSFLLPERPPEAEAFSSTAQRTGIDRKPALAVLIHKATLHLVPGTSLGDMPSSRRVFLRCL